MSDYVQVTIEMVTDGDKSSHSVEYPTGGWTRRKAHVATAIHACLTGIFSQGHNVKEVIDTLQKFDAHQEDVE